MIYPINIFSPEPSTGGIRPFIIFIAFKAEFNITKELGYGATIDILSPRGGFVLPMPNDGMIDASANSYSTEPSLMGEMAIAAGKVVDGSIPVVSNAMAKVGKLPDPRLTQVYTGTTPRTWTSTWQMVPQSLGESAAAAAILWWIKYSAAPDRMGNDKVGFLLTPHIYKIIFSNPLLHYAMSFDKMALASYSINYFAQGYSSTYKDMMPKQISLTLTFKEFGIKTKEDWMF